MKNRKKVVLTAMIAAAALAACGVKSDSRVTSGEMVVPEVSSEDLLVSSLEYLLLNDTDEDAQDQDVGESDAQDVTENTENATDEQTPQDEDIISEDDIQGDKAVIYYGNGASYSLKQETTAVEAITPDELVNALARHNIVSLDTKVLSFEQEQQDGALVLQLDLSKAVGEYLRTMSKEAECVIIASISNTFLDNFVADAVCLTVEGKPLTTSNMEYTEPLGKCTPEELMEAMEAPDADDSEQDIESDAADEEQRKLPLIEEKKN